MKTLVASTLVVIALASTGALAETRNQRSEENPRASQREDRPRVQFEIQIGTSDLQNAESLPATNSTTEHFFTVEIQEAFMASSVDKLMDLASNGDGAAAYDEPDCPPLPTQECADSWKVKTINPFVQTINPFE